MNAQTRSIAALLLFLGLFPAQGFPAEISADSLSARPVALLLPGASSGDEARGMAAIIGTVIDRDSRLPIQNAKVEVMGTDKSSLTQPDGQYRLAGLDRGIFQIRAKAEGYESSVLNNIRIEPGREGEVFFTLTRVKKTATDPSYAIESMPVVRRNPSPRYSPRARRLRLEGTVWVKLQVNESGRVENAVAMNSSFTLAGTSVKKSGMSPVVTQASHELTDAALSAARMWEFQPAVARGKAIKTWVTIPFKYSLEHRKPYGR
ncbi:MAG: energy transducer TonB [Acidobacteriota bacterium]